MASFLHFKPLNQLTQKDHENDHNNYPAHVHDDRYFRPGKIRQSKE